MAIVSGLFTDYLEPTGIADPRTQLLTEGTQEPVVQPLVQPLTKPAPTYEQQPLTKTLSSGFTKEPVTAITAPERITGNAGEVQQVDEGVFNLLNQMLLGDAPIDLQYDFNNDGRVSAADIRALQLNPSLYTPPVQTVDTSYIDLDALNNLDTSYIDPNLVDNLTYQDVTESLTGIGSAPTTPDRDWETV